MFKSLAIEPCKLTWINEVKRNKSKTFYEAVRLFTTDTTTDTNTDHLEILKVGDSVYLYNESGEEHYIALVLELSRASKDGTGHVKCQWYYRKSDIPYFNMRRLMVGQGRSVCQRFPVRDHEIYLSDHTDMNSLISIVQKVFVYGDDQWNDAASSGQSGEHLMNSLYGDAKVKSIDDIRTETSLSMDAPVHVCNLKYTIPKRRQPPKFTPLAIASVQLRSIKEQFQCPQHDQAEDEKGITLVDVNDQHLSNTDKPTNVVLSLPSIPCSTVSLESEETSTRSDVQSLIQAVDASQSHTSWSDHIEPISFDDVIHANAVWHDKPKQDSPVKDDLIIEAPSIVELPNNDDCASTSTESSQQPQFKTDTIEKLRDCIEKRQQSGKEKENGEEPVKKPKIGFSKTPKHARFPHAAIEEQVTTTSSSTLRAIKPKVSTVDLTTRQVLKRPSSAKRFKKSTKLSPNALAEGIQVVVKTGDGYMYQGKPPTKTPLDNYLTHLEQSAMHKQQRSNVSPRRQHVVQPQQKLPIQTSKRQSNEYKGTPPPTFRTIPMATGFGQTPHTPFGDSCATPFRTQRHQGYMDPRYLSMQNTDMTFNRTSTNYPNYSSTYTTHPDESEKLGLLKALRDHQLISEPVKRTTKDILFRPNHPYYAWVNGCMTLCLRDKDLQDCAETLREVVSRCPSSPPPLPPMDVGDSTSMSAVGSSSTPSSSSYAVLGRTSSYVSPTVTSGRIQEPIAALPSFKYHAQHTSQPLSPLPPTFPPPTHAAQSCGVHSTSTTAVPQSYPYPYQSLYSSSCATDAFPVAPGSNAALPAPYPPPYVLSEPGYAFSGHAPPPSHRFD